MEIILNNTLNSKIEGQRRFYDLGDDLREALASGKYNQVKTSPYHTDMIQFIHLLEGYTNIVGLDLSSYMINFDGVVTALARLTQLQTLNLSRSMGPLKITTSTLGFSDPTIGYLNPLAHLTRLQTLDLSYNNTIVEAPGFVTALAGLTQLQTLNLTGTTIVEAPGFVTALAGLTQLQTLSVSPRTIVEAPGFVTALARLPNLQILDLSISNFGEYAVEFADALARSTSLASLNLSNHFFRAHGVAVAEALAGCKTLHSLEFGGGNSNKLEKVFIKAVIDRGDLDHIASVMMHNPYISLEHVENFLALYGIGEGDHSLYAGAGSSWEGDEVGFMPQKLEYSFELHDALIASFGRRGLVSHSEKLRQMEQDTLKSILGVDIGSNSLLIKFDDANTITHLFLRNLDKLAQSSNYTKSIPSMVKCHSKDASDQVYAIAGNIIESLSILDTISAQLIFFIKFGQKIIPLIRNLSDKEGLDLTEANIGTTAEFYSFTEIAKKPGSILQYVLSDKTLGAILQSELSKNPQLEKVFSDALGFIIGHLAYLPKDLLDIVSMVDSDSGSAGAGRGAREDEDVLDEAEADPYADMPVLEYVGDVELGGDAPPTDAPSA